MYSRGKAELEKEQKKLQSLHKAVKQIKPEDIIKLAVPLNKTLETTKRMIEETTLSLVQLRKQSESIKAIGDVTTQFIKFNTEIQQLRHNQEELIDLLKAVITETYKDAQTYKRIEAMLI